LLFKGNPLKRLKYTASHIAYKKFQSQSIQENLNDRTYSLHHQARRSC
jgi:hypothetical protein